MTEKSPRSSVRIDDPIELFGVRTTIRGMLTLLGFLTAGGAGFWGLATAQDVKSVADAAKVNAGRIGLMEANLSALTSTMFEVRDSSWHERADNLAKEASMRIEDRERADQIRKLVRERALQNLRDRRPLRDGLDQYL